MSTTDLRQTLRSEGRRSRRAVTGEARRVAERRILGHLRSLHLPYAPAVGVSVADDGEPDLAEWVGTLRARGFTIALPVIAGEADDSTMHFRRWDHGDTLTPGRYGIPCPPDDGAGREVAPSLVFVPLVRFDAQGNRLGRGAGYYDRWLSTHRAATVGVAFECQRADHLHHEPHDVPLDRVVTELGVRYAAENRADCRSQDVSVDQDGVPCE